MAPGILGKKIGMTQFFDDEGRVVPVTVLQAGPCVVVQRKNVDRDGYEAIQVGLVDFMREKLVKKPQRGHFAKAGVAPMRFLREFRLEDGDEAFQPGDRILAEHFKPSEKVSITGTSKGKGFQGVVKRHGFRGGRKTHGSMFHRAPGSIGQSAWPSRVFKGVRLPGRMGGNRVTVSGLEIVEVHPDDNVILVRGAVPGPNGGFVSIRRAR
ncbi:MAG: 50S ribosomal protein L3 [Acidobacteriia bacterium]|nr:50S ribosomal protein L3 [Terriglobia bacterium]MYC66690.1 50S ribosomal protein L3 [Terriglobia bacterium]